MLYKHATRRFSLSKNPVAELDGMAQLITWLLARAGIKGFTGHDLRRTFTTLVTTASRDEFLTLRPIRGRFPGLGDRYILYPMGQLVEALQKYSPIRQAARLNPQSYTTMKTSVTQIELSPRYREGIIISNLQSKSPRGMIRRLSIKDADVIFEIINKAAHAYQSAVPDDCYHDPYMPEEELLREMAGMTFFGWHEGGKVVGVIGFQRVKDVTLVRHAYVLPEYQRKGIGTRLLNHIKQMTKTKKLLVGTWADAIWAIQFYQKHGFKLMPDKDELLIKYWDVPYRQIENSVVLGIQI